MDGVDDGRQGHTHKNLGRTDGGGTGGRLFGLTLYIATWLGGRKCFCCIWSVVFGLFFCSRVLVGGGVGGRIHLIFLRMLFWALDGWQTCFLLILARFSLSSFVCCVHIFFPASCWRLIIVDSEVSSF